MARSNAPPLGSPVPTFRIAKTPTACARGITSSRSASNSGPSMCACESTNIFQLLQARAVRHVFSECRDHRPALFAVRRCDHHSLRFITAKLPRFEVSDHHYLAADQFLRFVILRNSGEHLPWLFLV